ncbi:class I SAM-dependent rRNA methyltransferase [Ketobacter alkanivorans]|uniref:RlmI/RlmK family 23S rRNA methyltransferase n=1 Tax=Ketobacter alkanivorans TaxID=1917421 RepID=A0A2K9LPK1_9GAMM|nr:class I SAM-dependent rRNA methyltransferase [Ketobacter alkanivorans]AUM13395.1 RlmI/RlmK family 23S rRNA methyltransferase [Ketobacter alkanivorans]
MSDSNLPRIRLKSKEERRIKSGHLWIYSNEVDTAVTPLQGLEAGLEVLFEEASGKPLGRGYVNPHSLICGRLLTRDAKRSLDQRFLEFRLQQALALRERAYDQPYYRLVYGDSDGLSGLVVDRFGDYLVAQLNTAGMERLKAPLLAALEAVLKPKAVLWRNDSAQREQEGLPLEVVVAAGEWPQQIDVVENGLAFQVASESGQKTGWFYDHRESRRELTRWVKGKRVLDVFSYVGGWGLQAMAAGAASLTAIDASEAALDQLQANAERQGVAENVTSYEGNAFDVLRALLEQEEKFDVIVVDPPAFIKRKKDFKSGLNAYSKLNGLALRLLERDGILVSASCSMHLPEETLLDTVRGAARHVDRHAQLVYRGTQGPDHPVHPAIPETHYLKALFFRVNPAL